MVVYGTMVDWMKVEQKALALTLCFGFLSARRTLSSLQPKTVLSTAAAAAVIWRLRCGNMLAACEIFKRVTVNE